jgi:hypothetical protein
MRGDWRIRVEFWVLMAGSVAAVVLSVKGCVGW